MLAECLAAELRLRIGRAAASHAERCATALSEAQAAAREVSQLLHRASLAELDLMPGRISCYLQIALSQITMLRTKCRDKLKCRNIVWQ